MNRYICGENVNQLSLMPMCLDDMITSENPVRAISKIVEAMDIPSLGFKYTETKTHRRKTYDPTDIFKIYA